jgi:hypothetical protein
MAAVLSDNSEASRQAIIASFDIPVANTIPKTRGALPGAVGRRR